MGGPEGFGLWGREGSHVHCPLHSDLSLLPRREGHSGVQIPVWAGTCWGGLAGALGPASSNSPAMCVERLEEAALSLLGPSGPVSPGRSEDVGRETQQRGVSWEENQRVWASAAGLTCPGPGTLSHSKGLVPLCARAPPSSSSWVSGGLSEEGADQWSSLSCLSFPSSLPPPSIAPLG